MLDQNTDTKFCLCGCEAICSGRERIKKGHGKKVQEATYKCKCGCGEAIKKFNVNYREIVYAYGHGPKSERIRKIQYCNICRKKIEITESRLSESRGKFCSKVCYSKSKTQKPIEFQCKSCLKPFFVHGCNGGKTRVRAGAHFCSRRCQGDYLAGNKHYGWKGGTHRYYGPNWNIQRKNARLRDKICQICLQKPTGMELTVHHLKSFRFFGPERYLEANDLSNLICLCRKCHSKIESILYTESRFYESREALFEAIKTNASARIKIFVPGLVCLMSDKGELPLGKDSS